MRKSGSILCCLLILALLSALLVLPAAAVPSEDWTSHVEEISSLGDTNYITKAEQLAWLAREVNGGNDGVASKSYMIKNDLNLSAHYWVPIGTADHPFKGTINGENTGIKITGMTINATADGVYGLVGYGNGATVSVLDLSGSIEMTSGGTAGAVIGDATGTCNVSNVNSTVTITASGGTAVTVGGLVGSATKTNLSNCTQNGSITVAGNTAATNAIVGGLVGVGYADTVVSGCKVAKPAENVTGQAEDVAIGVTATATAQVGGMIGQASGNTTIQGTAAENSYNRAPVTVTAPTSHVGGLVGQVSGGVLTAGATYIWSLADLTVYAATAADVGGYIGSVANGASAALTKAIYSSSITVDGGGSANVGGILGSQTGTTTATTLDSCTYTTGLKVLGVNNATLVDVADTARKITVTSTGTVYTGGIYGKADKLTVTNPTVGDREKKAGASSQVTITSTGTVGGIGGMSSAQVYVTSGDSEKATLTSLKVVGTGDTTPIVGGAFGAADGMPGFTLEVGNVVVSCAKGSAKVGGLFGTATNMTDTTNAYSMKIGTLDVTSGEKNTSNGADSSVGGLFGVANGLSNVNLTEGDTISVTSTGANSNVGGLFGSATDLSKDAPNQILLNANKITVTAVGTAAEIGGVFGEFGGSLSNFHLRADSIIDVKNKINSTSANSSNVGGIAGQFKSGAVADGRTLSITSGPTTANVGGVKVTSSSYGCKIGGFVGLNEGTLRNISMGDRVVLTEQGSYGSMGGFAGKNTGTIDFCYTSAECGGKSVSTSNMTLGGLVGDNSGTISNCYRDEPVDGRSYSSCVGGLVGKMSAGTLTKSYVSASVTSETQDSMVGGLIGQLTGGTVSDCYTAGTVNGSMTGGVSALTVGGFIGDYDAGTVANSYSAMTVTGGSVAGGFFGRFDNTDDSGITKCFYRKDSEVNGSLNDSGAGQKTTMTDYGHLKAVSRAELSAEETFTGWDYTNIWRFGSSDINDRAYPYPELILSSTDGNGVAVNYDVRWYTQKPADTTNYEISDEADLAGLAALVNGKIVELGPISFSGKTITLENTLDLQSAQWLPIGDAATYLFAGTFDGGGNRINGLRVKDISPDTVADAGIFGHTATGAEIKNLTLESLDVSGTTNAGALVAVNGGKVTNTTVFLNGNVSAGTNAGAVVGQNSGAISGLAATIDGTVTATNGTVGGVAGTSTGAISGSAVTVNKAVTATTGKAGGIVGETTKAITIPTVTIAGDISGTTHAGGVAGTSGDSITVATKLTVSGAVGATGANGYAGGVAGYTSAAISVPTAVIDGTVTATNGYAGGIAGQSTATISGTTVTVKKAVTSTVGKAGGIVGDTTAAVNIDTVSVEKTITGTTHAGGVAGNTTADITISKTLTVSGEVKATGTAGSTYAGGVAGQSTGAVMVTEKLTLSGAVTANAAADSYAGGVVGDTTSTTTITDLAVNQDITAGKYAGGVAGQTTAAISVPTAIIDGTVKAANGSAGGIAGKSTGKISGTTVTIKKAIAATTGKAGGIAGESSGEITITTGTVSGTVTGTTHAGGVAGDSSGTIQNSNLNLQNAITAGQNVGGVSGQATASITNVTITFSGSGAVEATGATGYAGGVAGQTTVSITTATVNLGSTGTVTAAGANGYAGGIAGKSSGSVTGGTVAGGTVKAAQYVGGAVGELTGTLTANTPNVKTVAVNGVTIQGTGNTGNTYVGGVFGHVNGVMAAGLTVSGTTSVTATGGTADLYVGGVVGLAEGSVLRDITVGGALAVAANGADKAHVYGGGVAGKLAVTTNENKTYALTAADQLGVYQGVTNAQVSGLTLTVTGNTSGVGEKTAYVGGLAGQSDKGSVYDSSVTGSVLVSGFDTSYAGGGVGQVTGAYLVNNTANCGLTIEKAKTAYYAGGFAGRLENATARFNAVSSANQITVTHIAGTYANIYAGGFVGSLDNATAWSVSNNSATQPISISGGNANNIYAGGFVGQAGAANAETTITASYATGNCSVESAGKGYAGGFAGNLYNGTVESCYGSGNVTVNSREAWSGGFAGALDGSNPQVSNCYAVDGSVSATGNTTAYAGGFAGNHNGSVNAVYAAAASVSATATSGTPASGPLFGKQPADTTKTVNALEGWDNATNSITTDFGDGNANWCLVSGKNSDRPMLVAIEGWDNQIDFASLRDNGLNNLSVSTASQFGTAARLINDESFAKLLTDGRAASTVTGITLADDIDLNGKLWVPMKELKNGATLDGKNKTISGLTADAVNYNNYGLVSTNNGTIKDLTISGANVKAGTPAGFAAGTNAGTIQNVTVTGSTLTGTDVAGGVAGVNSASATVTKAAVTNSTTVKGKTEGGIVGTNSGTVSDSTANAKVTYIDETNPDNTTKAGGAVGINTGTVTGITSNATVLGGTAGGVVGENSGTVNSSKSEAGTTVTGSQYAGGVVGENKTGATIGATGAQGNVTSAATVSGRTVGGIVGYNGGTVQNSDTLTAAKLNGSVQQGGIAGATSGGTLADNNRYGTVTTPAASPASWGSATGDSVTVTLTTATEGANIYYTTNGTVPTSSSTQYTAAFSVTSGTTVKALAVKTGMFNSSVATFTYTKPAPAPAGGGGGGGGGGGAAPAPAVEVPVTGSKSSIEISATISGADAALNDISENQLREVGVGADVVIDLTGLGKTIESVTIPKTAWENISNAKPTGLLFKLTTGTVEFDEAALAAVATQAKGTTIQLVVLRGTKVEKELTAAQKETIGKLEDTVILSVSLLSGKTNITDFKGGKATVETAYELKTGQKERGLETDYVAQDGALTVVPMAYRTGVASFTVEHFSIYVISYSAERAAICPKDSTCPIAAFTDTDPAAWYHDGVHYVLESGIMSGYGGAEAGTFGPADTTSRAMVAQILWNLEGHPGVNDTLDFSDLEEGKWYLPAIRWAVSVGMMSGYGGAEAGTFGPNDPITREQLVTILCRYANFKGEDVSAGIDLSGYVDMAQVSSWALPAMRWAVDLGVIQGKGTGAILAPLDNASRAEIATVIMRYLTAN